MKSLSVIIAIVLSLALSPSPDSISVIVNSQNPMTSMTITEIRSYWMRRPKKRWEALDRAIKPVDRKDKCEAKRIFYSSVIKMSEESVDSYFYMRQYQTGELPPVKLMSDFDVIEYVSNETGAIGYVLTSSLKEKDLATIKVAFSF